jgi:hypothetical protein
MGGRRLPYMVYLVILNALEYGVGCERFYIKLIVGSCKLGWPKNSKRPNPKNLYFNIGMIFFF